MSFNGAHRARITALACCTAPAGRFAQQRPSKLHFDFRLEMGGVLKSWSVPKGPTLDPRAKRLAVMTEAHPVAYLKYEGCIAEGNYGAGDQLIWDTGTYIPKDDPLRQLQSGKITFELRGAKLHGQFTLLAMKGRERQWLLIKSKDEAAQPD